MGITQLSLFKERLKNVYQSVTSLVSMELLAVDGLLRNFLQ